MTHFRIIPDFDQLSANGAKCYFTHMPLQRPDPDRPQQQAHEVDEFILRGPEIAFEGYMDVRPAVIIETARELLGMGTAAEVKDLFTANQLLTEANEALQDRLSTAENRLRDMILANAEQIVQISALETEIESAYDELYGADEDILAEELS